ncbi:MAG TPA: hypothetical protein V6D16_09080, partial [Candidatus Obscuribacterales bacterium]
MSYFFYQASESRAKEQIQVTLDTQVKSIEGQLTQAEESIIGLAAGVKTMRALEIKDPEAYKKIVFEIFQKRPKLTMGVGFGQASAQIVPSQQWFYPYFYVDQGVPGAVGQQLPPPYSNIRYSELFADDQYPEREYYKVPVTQGKKVWLEPFDWYGITMTSLLAPFYSDSGKMLGIVGEDVNVTALGEQVEAPVTRGGGYFVLLSQQGNLLAYPPDPEKAKIRANYQEIADLKQVWPQLQQGQAGLVQFQGILWAYQRIPQTNWLMLAAVPQSLVLGPVLQITIAGALGAGAVLALVVALFVRRL